MSGIVRRQQKPLQSGQNQNVNKTTISNNF